MKKGTSMTEQENASTKLEELPAQIAQLLEKLSTSKSLDPLKELFWTVLNYERKNQSLSIDNWPAKVRDYLYDTPILFAGTNDNFSIIYVRLLAVNLPLGQERQIVSQLLNSYPDAMFIFSNSTQDMWHFLNIKPDSQHAKRRLFRRITVGPEERLHTASRRLAMLELSQLGEHASRLDVLALHEEAFDVEAVTKDFFISYRNLFKILQKDLETQSQDAVWAHDYALQFLNRCMFLYFIQRKGWLGENKEFLRLLWTSYHSIEHENDSFFKNWLSVLFLEAFNNRFYRGVPRPFPEQIYTIIANAPYLNGGLFYKNHLDTKHSDCTITDLRFEQIFLFLEHYNFTISEDSPLDQEIAVDPEMIGKIYESLVNVSTEIDERGDAGIFYTPRTEIDLMCRLSLVNHLSTKLGHEYKDVLYKFVFALEPEEQSEADDQLALRDLWEKIKSALESTTVVDPACGSGSFLVGMLSILDNLLHRVNERLYYPDNAYERKKKIIERCLYGVDVMEWAAHIAELRLWLTLIVDANDSDLDKLRRDGKPLLPHLSFKVRFGDSLVQEIGRLYIGPREASLRQSALTRALNDLKQDKIDFYYSHNNRYKRKEDLDKEELEFFRNMLMHQVRVKEEVLKKFQRQIKASDIQQMPMLNASSQKIQKADVESLKRIKELEQELQVLKHARNSLTTPRDIPFLWGVAFVEVFTGEKGGFDIVIGNPPYVRQEQIADPHLERDVATTKEQKQLYKSRIAQAVYRAFPSFFGYREGKETAAHKLDAKSDLYIYFYFYCLSLLNPQGTFCFITSNSWLDVGYGADLQEFLLRNCHMKMIIDNQFKRSFASADVNTVITLFSAPQDKAHVLNTLVRFILFKKPFEQILDDVLFKQIEQTTSRTSTEVYRLNPISQERLLSEALVEVTDVADVMNDASAKGKKAEVLLKESKEEYISNKWGGKYLRAPDIYWTILEKGKEKLVRLGDIADVRFGIKTGANEFFYLKEKQIRQWGIETEYLRPVVKSPKECRQVLISATDLEFEVFVCQKDKHELKGTNALEYIKWGESRGFHINASLSSRAKWWSLSFSTANSVFVKEANDTSAVFYNPDRYLVDCRLYYAALSPMTLVYLNSALGAMLFEIYNRAGLGEGARSMMVSDYAQVPVLSYDTDVRSVLQNIYPLPPRKMRETPAREWREIDTVVFDALGLTQGERDAVYEEVINLVQSRLQKANSLRPVGNREAKELQKRVDAVNNTLGIWMDVPEELETEVDSSYA